MHVLARNETNSQVLGDRITVARNAFLRMRGLMWSPPLESGAGLWLTPGNSIHMFFVRYPLDILFLDKELRIVGAIPELPANRFSSICGRRQAHSVLELPAGMIAHTATQEGHVVSFSDVESVPA